MKTNVVKKLVAIGCTAVMALSVAACGNAGNGDDVTVGKNKADYSVAIVKQMDHASLDEIANAIAAQLDAIEAKEGISIDYKIYSHKEKCSQSAIYFSACQHKRYRKSFKYIVF